jgi:hypothetical protein
MSHPQEMSMSHPPPNLKPLYNRDNVIRKEYRLFLATKAATSVVAAEGTTRDKVLVDSSISQTTRRLR